MSTYFFIVIDDWLTQFLLKSKSSTISAKLTVLIIKLEQSSYDPLQRGKIEFENSAVQAAPPGL